MESKPSEDTPLEFDTVVHADRPVEESAADHARCTACSAAITDEYFDVNGHSVCAGCHAQIEQHAQTPRGWGPLFKALAFGVAAAVAGAILYYSVVAITSLEIGIVAIAIGYMVGYGVRRGTGGRGGRRFQVIAVILTYWAVGLAYVPLAIREASSQRRQEAAETQSAQQPPAGDDDRSSAGTSVVVALGFLAGLSLALPVLVVAGSMPSGLISGAIIAFGMQQAWRMTAAPHLDTSGPYRIGSAPPAMP